jgi:hypothetical protein
MKCTDVYTRAHEKHAAWSLRKANHVCRIIGIEAFDRRMDGELAARMRDEMAELEERARALEAGSLDADEIQEEEEELLRVRLEYLLGRWIAFGLHRGERGEEC